MNNNDTPPAKFKLDKLEIPPIKKISGKSLDENSGKTYAGSAGLSQDDRYGEMRKFIVIISAGLVAMILVMIISIVVWKSFLSKEKKYEPWDIYAVIGPIHATVGKAGELRMTVNVNCLKPAVQKLVKRKSVEIKDRLLFSLNSPGVDQMIAKKDYEALKSYIRDEIIAMLDGNVIGEVYFSDFVIY